MTMYNETLMLPEPTAAADNGHKFACSYPECSKVYSRKYRLTKHLKEAHGIENDTECTRNFKCPFNCGVRASVAIASGEFFFGTTFNLEIFFFNIFPLDN